MAEYESIHGTRVRYLTSDPTLTDSSTEGQVWYNSTTGTNRALVQIKAWSSGGNMAIARRESGAAGTQTASVVFGGGLAPSGTPDSNATEEYNGFSYSTGGTLNAAREGMGAAGTQTAALGFGGATYPSPGQRNVTEGYNGSTWTSLNNLNANRSYVQGFGTQTAALAVGGAPDSPVNLQTESWDGTNWTNLPAPSNVPVGMLTGASAGTQTAGVTFGGANVNDSPPGAQATTLDWNGSAWTAGNNMNTARRRLGGAGTSTAALGFGGYLPSPYSAATEEYDGNTWTTSSASLPTATAHMHGSGSMYAALSSGGRTSTDITGATYEYNSNILSPTTGVWAASTNLPGTRGNGSVSQSGTTSAAYYAGGSNPGAPYAPDTPTIEYNGSSWTAGGALSTGRISAGSGGTLTAGLTWGGFLGPGTGDNTNTTEEYNGTSWTGGGNLPTPQRECYGDGTQTDSIFGGSFGAPNVTALKYDGSSWTAISNLPSGRFGAAGAGNSSAFVLAGGAPNKTTLEWNGSSWGAGGDVPTSPLFAMAAGGTQTSALFYGGEGGGVGLLSSTFFYNGTAMESRSNMTQSQSTDNSGDAGSCLAMGGGSPAISVEEWDESAAGTATASTLTTS